MMTIDKINVETAIENTRRLLRKEKNLSPAMKASIELLITVISLLVNRLNLNSDNSSIPPSKDPASGARRKTRKDKGIKRGKRKPGGQKGHPGSTLMKTDTPDEIEDIKIDRRTLPPGSYKNRGFESRQVFDINISVHVTEYRAHILEDQNGKQYIAKFPEGVTKAVQYGNGVKSHATYMSQFQLIPLARVKDYFDNQLELPISKGSISNFNKEASSKLDCFVAWAKEQLISADLNHADETGINLNGKRIWLHNISNENVTLYHPDEKRGKEAMDRMGVLPHFKGILCHDHWKPYFHYDCTHSLCNAHHIRELERAWEQDGQKWAKSMQKLLEKINIAVLEADGVLPAEEAIKYQKRFRDTLTRGEKECPLSPKIPGKRGRQKKSKSRNLLERLRDFETETLLFTVNKIVPFTNNQGENDIRMTKVQQKISGCFRSIKGAQDFCRVRSFLSTCRKNNVNQTETLRDLFSGKLPDFMS